jgi:hypothetical protein
MSSSIEERLIAHYGRVTASVPAEGPGLDTLTSTRPIPHRRSWSAVVLISAAAATIVIAGFVVVARSSSPTTGPTGPSVSALPHTAPPPSADPTTTITPASVPEVPAAASCANADLLVAVQALHPDNPDWDPTSIGANTCRNGYAEVVVTFDQSRCPTPGVECRDNQRVWLHDVDGSWDLVDVGTGIGCSPGEITSSIEAACKALAGGPPIAVSEAYCAQAQSMEGERPEAYIGSAEQIADLEALRAVAPAEAAVHLDVLLQYLGSGAISASDPDSNLIENFPADVQDAIAQIFSINESNC